MIISENITKSVLAPVSIILFAAWIKYLKLVYGANLSNAFDIIVLLLLAFSLDIEIFIEISFKYT